MTRSDASAAHPLPALPFGEHDAEPITRLASVEDALAGVLPAIRRCSVVGAERAFRHKFAALSLGELRLLADAHTPLAADVGHSEHVTVLIPFQGRHHVAPGHGDPQPTVGQSAVLLPEPTRVDTRETSSALLVDLDPTRLQRTAAAMAGETEDVDLRLGQERELPLALGAFSFDRTFRGLCGLIDAYRGNVRSLALLALDDVVYRTVAAMMAPARLLVALTDRPGHVPVSPVDRVREYMAANLDRPVGLTDLERVSGLSASTLQFAFQKRHGCSPLQWLRVQRLEHARERLTRGEGTEDLAHLARESGFTDAGEFVRLFARRYGERPVAARRDVA